MPALLQAADDPSEDDAAVTDNVIVVTGHRREATSSRKTGQSVTVSPEDASRFDTLTHLKRESSVLAPETGRISPSGFVVPKVRGQDVKLTDVYLEDILLQDPYSGLPLIEDLDLRAFGSLEIHQGVPPPDVPGLNPIGTLRYRFRDVKSSSTTAGLQFGEPYGQSLWGLGIYRRKAEDAEDSATDARLYARHHQTGGHYKFYSDEGTPYNAADDTIRRRTNNDQRSDQAVPFIRQEIGPYRLEGLGWSYRADRGLASQSVLVPSAAREHANGHLANLRVTRGMTGLTPMSKMTVGTGITDSADHRDVSDPGRRFLGSAEQSDMLVQSRRVRASLSSVSEVLSLFLVYESGRTTVQNKLGSRLAVDLKRQTDVGSLGARLVPFSFLMLEAKGAARQHVDHLQGDAEVVVLEGEKTSSLRHTTSRAAGGSVAIGTEDYGIYLQRAYASRLPSLIEEFGNGSSVRPNGALLPESIHHQEIGVFVKANSGVWRLGAAGYGDATGNKIVFVPVMANAVKALNVRQTDVRGVDVHGETTLWKTTVYASASRLFPYDETQRERRLLPGIPERVLVGELEQRVQSFKLRWLSRYRSGVFRDLGNSVELPGAWIHDASVDLPLTLVSKNDLQTGLSVRNVFNVMDVPISAPDTKESRGRTSFSDVAGSPLPGRQWILSMALTI
jgi:hypothetical protein